MKIIRCPKCKVITTDDDFNNGSENCSVWTDNNWVNHYECFECEHEWTEEQGK